MTPNDSHFLPMTPTYEVGFPTHQPTHQPLIYMYSSGLELELEGESLYTIRTDSSTGESWAPNILRLCGNVNGSSNVIAKFNIARLVD